MVRENEAFPPVTMDHSRGHGCRRSRGLQQDRRLFSVDAALTEEEIGFLQELVDAGEVGRTITGLKSRAGLLRLVQLKYVTEQSTSLIQFSIASPMLAGMHSPKSDNAVNLSPQQRSRLVVQERG